MVRRTRQLATYHETTVQGAKASLNFTGERHGVPLMASADGSAPLHRHLHPHLRRVRPFLFHYTVVLDPSLPQPYTYDGSAYAAQNGTEPFLLCAINGLSWAEHTVEITNTGSGMLLDQVIYETQFGASG